MMSLSEKIEALVYLGKEIADRPERLRAAVRQAKVLNPWFIEENQWKALDAIAKHFLHQEKLETWVEAYHLENFKGSKIVAQIPAGNIPLVGFHDLLCCFICDHISMIKYSDKDSVLISTLIQIMLDRYPQFRNYFLEVDRLKDFEGVIATGSNNSARYFESYFGKYPNIIRKNRNGVAILTGEESTEDLLELGEDIFSYFGLGCRNVSKLYVPEEYDLTFLLEVLHQFNELVLHHKYKNNFDYCMATSLLNKDDFLNNGCVILLPNPQIASRISTLHYERYSSLNRVVSQLKSQENEIQCILSNDNIEGLETLTFGTSQQPGLKDYPDGVDTVQFLMQL